MRSHGWNLNRTLGICVILVPAISISPAAVWSSTSQELATGTQSRSTMGNGLGGEDAACIRCHKDTVGRLLDNPHENHWTAARATSILCAECHGPGAAHIQSGGAKSTIFNPAAATASEVSGVCLKCHAGKHVVFQRSAHGRRDVSCLRCHSMHAPHESRHLLTSAQPELCFQCHDELKPLFAAPFRHKVMEGLILCTDCHEPHGSFGEQLQRSPAQQDLICTKCHTEVARPFRFEHAIIRTEGCSACHLPHGGANSHLLNRANVNTICLLCHFPPQMSSTGASLVHAHDPTAKGQICIDCHAEIHGSNENPVFLNKK